MAVKKKGALGKKILGKALGAAANFVPGGSIAKGAVKAIGGMLGKGKGASGGKRRSRNPLSIRSIRRFQARLIKAKMRGKILKAEMSGFKI